MNGADETRALQRLVKVCHRAEMELEMRSRLSELVARDHARRDSPTVRARVDRVSFVQVRRPGYRHDHRTSREYAPRALTTPTETLP
jgi:hypothetical protein